MDSDNKHFSKELINNKLGWIKEFKDDILKYSRMIKASSCISNYIKHNGIHFGMYDQLQVKIFKLQYCQESLNFTSQLMDQVRNLELKLRIGERSLGVSDIIESVFGRFKNMEQQQSGSGFTQLLLALPAIIGENCSNTIKQAMMSVKNKDIKQWFEENIGDSVQKLRTIVLGKSKHANI